MDIICRRDLGILEKSFLGVADGFCWTTSMSTRTLAMSPMLAATGTMGLTMLDLSTPMSTIRRPTTTPTLPLGWSRLNSVQDNKGVQGGNPLLRLMSNLGYKHINACIFQSLSAIDLCIIYVLVERLRFLSLKFLAKSMAKCCPP